LIRVEEAEKIVKSLTLWSGEQVRTLPDAAGYVLAEALVADRDYPPFHRAMMDGIAVSWEAYAGGQRAFALTGTIAAGSPETTLPHPGAAFEIMTGAAVPANADLVIPYEQLKIEGAHAMVTESRERPRYENVHLRGSDCRRGDEIAPAGSILNGPRIGIAASFGYARVTVQATPRVLVVATGDELVPVDVAPLPHQIRLSNGHALRASLIAAGIGHVELAHVKDDPDLLRKHFDHARREYDVLIYSGAVSMGKFDYLPKLWEEAGVTKLFHGVSQRPGKPLWFGRDESSGTTVIGLPGNPVSSLVCLHRYFLPAEERFAVLEEEVRFDKPLTYFLPVRVRSLSTGSLSAAPAAVKNSGEFAGLALSDGFLELPRDESVFPAGRAYRYFSWGRA
jgi:molybdopterin molybdotransferase